MIRSRFVRYLLTLVLPSGLLCLIFLSSLYHEEQARVRQSLEVAERLRLTVGARSLSSDIGRIASDVRFMASLPSLAAALENGVRGGRWYSLMDKVYAPATLSAAWARVRANGGAA